MGLDEEGGDGYGPSMEEGLENDVFEARWEGDHLEDWIGSRTYLILEVGIMGGIHRFAGSGLVSLGGEDMVGLEWAKGKVDSLNTTWQEVQIVPVGGPNKDSHDVEDLELDRYISSIESAFCATDMAAGKVITHIQKHAIKC